MIGKIAGLATARTFEAMRSRNNTQVESWPVIMRLAGQSGGDAAPLERLPTQRAREIDALLPHRWTPLPV